MCSKYTSAKGKAARVHPPLTRRTECAACDKYAKCTQRNGAWLCEECTFAPELK